MTRSKAEQSLRKPIQDLRRALEALLDIKTERRAQELKKAIADLMCEESPRKTND